MRIWFAFRAGFIVVSLALFFRQEFGGEEAALADPTPSGAEQAQVTNGDFSGTGAGEVGTPPTNYDFETAGGTVGTPPTNNNFSTGNFTGWTLTGSPTIQSGGPGGYYAQLSSGHKITSSAFTVDAGAQVLTFNAAAITTGTFQFKMTVWYGTNYASSDIKYSTQCSTGCTSWSSYAFDIVPRQSQSIKVEIARFLGDLKVDDTAVGTQVLVGWSPVAGDKVSRQTGGPNGAYAKTTTTITSAAFTLDAKAQNGTADFKIEGASGTYNVYVLSGAGYATETHVFNGLYSDSSSWGTKTFAVGNWASQSIKLKVVPGANTSLLVDRTAIARNEIPGWTSTGTTPMAVGLADGITYLNSYSTIHSEPIRLDYQSYYGNTRVNWFHIVYRLHSPDNLNCQGVPIGSTLNVYFAGGPSPYFGASSATEPIGVWLEKYFYIYNPNSPNTPSPQTGWLDVTGWPNKPTLYSCDNATLWKPPELAVVERIDAPPVTDCSSKGEMADELNVKPSGASTQGVDVVSGNYFRGQTDLSIPGKGIPLRFTRCYSSHSKTGGLGVTGPLGNKWSHNWQASLQEFDVGNHVHMRLPGGASMVWRKFGDSFLPPPGFEGTLVKNQDGTYTLTTWHKIIYTFNSAGKLTSVKDRNLNSIDLGYDGNGRLSTIAAPGSRALTLGYNAQNRITTLSDSAGRSVGFGYDTTNGDLTSVTNAVNGITGYQYSGHLLTQATDPNNHLSVRNTYDGRNRVSQQLDALNAATVLSYSTPGLGASRVTDPKNYQTTYYFDTSMRVTDVKDHNGGVTTFGYDSDNNKTTVTNALLKSWTSTYDTNGNVLSVTDPLRQPNGSAESGVLQCGNLDTGNGLDDDGDGKFDDGCPNMKSTYTTVYNDPDEQADPLGRRVDYIYNSTGNLTRLAALDPGGAVKALTCFEVDSSGLVTASVQSTNLLVPAGPTDPCTGNKTLYGYDSPGNQTCVVNARFSSTTTCASDPGKKATFIYDLAGRVKYATDEITNNVRPVRGTAPETGDQCGPGSGDLVDQDGDGTSDDGCPSTSYTYDALGNLLTQQDELGNVTSNVYDSKGILIKSLDAKRYPRGTAETGTNQCGALGTGDGADNETPSDGWVDDGCPSVIDSYDSADRLTEVLDAAGGKTTYGYDAAGNNTSVTSPRATLRPVGANGPETSAQCGSTGFGNGLNEDAAGDDTVADDGCPSTFYAYDALNRLQSETDSLGHATSYTYDSASNPQQRTDARGLITKYFVDEANRPDRVEHWNGATLVDTVDFTLDIAGNRTQMVDPSGTTKYAYDALDRRTCIGPNTISGPCPSGNVAYQYDDLPGGSAADYPGQRTKITYPDGKYVDYTYLADGRMSSVTDWLTKQTTYEYGDAGALTKNAYPNGTCTTYGYDYGGERLIAVTNRRMAAPPTCSPSDTVISAFTYIMDPVGNRTAMGDLAGNQGYVYDALHQLKQAQYADPQTDNYTYDANGNRLTKNSTNYAYDAADRMTCVWSGAPTPPCPAGSLNYGYDNNGNQTSRGSDTFQYDHENQLTQSVISGVTSSSVYNGDGLRMSHTISGQTTNYSWDTAAGLPVVLQDGTNTYVYGLDLISATNNNGIQTYVLSDGLGSTTDVVDASGNAIATYRYDVFGAIRSQTGSSPNYWLFTGEQRDGDSSLYFLRARYYDPAIGRFLGQDPLGEGNGYSYVLNNPVNFVDPYGLHVCDILPGKAEDKCRDVADKLEASANALGDVAATGAEVAANAAESCWDSRICRTVAVEAGVFACSALTGGWGAVGCAVAGSLVLSYEDAADCVAGDTMACVYVGANIGISAAFAGAGALTGNEVRWFSRGYRSNFGIHGPHHRFAEYGGKKMVHLETVRYIPGGPSGNQIIWRQALPRWWPKWATFKIGWE